ncbi:MAG: bifunctional DNA-formamidopyrimidine glycosylase/DNA-(apurinic or apyrimidinic site) lyase [Acidobacteria bacterium]|nr:bifunctional DNA-formamidopyrimidine glycosylase/DNA-(apurinic or apyrimidinic site) lyase [Acidobacteriota bacterium]
MPELPEVETVARQLAPLVRGRHVRGLEVFDPRLHPERCPPIGGFRVADVYRGGKQVLFELRPPRPGAPLWLAVHLRMTGRLIWTAARQRAPREHVRARLALRGGSVSLVDPRRFGTFTWLADPGGASTGIDPTGPAFTRAVLTDLLTGSRQPMKPWLLRQDRLVGIGNIYASEILHRARISPLRPANTLNEREIGRLHASIRHILARAIECCGTTFSDFQDARGEQGGFQKFLAVYEREGKPCRRCRTPIRRLVQQQRSTYYCPTCAR